MIDSLAHQQSRVNRDVVQSRALTYRRQDQVHRSRDKEQSVELMTQEKEATRLHNEQRAVIEGLRSQEQQLQVVKTRAEDTGDIDDIEKAEDDLRDVSRARIAISQFATVTGHWQSRYL